MVDALKARCNDPVTLRRARCSACWSCCCRGVSADLGDGRLLAFCNIQTPAPCGAESIICFMPSLPSSRQLADRASMKALHQCMTTWQLRIEELARCDDMAFRKIGEPCSPPTKRTGPSKWRRTGRIARSTYGLVLVEKKTRPCLKWRARPRYPRCYSPSSRRPSR